MKTEKAVSNTHFNMMVNVMSIMKNIRSIKKEIIRSGIKEGSHVLDYGCGPGFVTVPASKIVGSRGVIYALDIHPLAIKNIERKITKHNLENVRTIIADNGTGLPDESIDVALLFNVIFMIKDKEKLIAELYRILKKGGVVSIVNSGLGSKFKNKQVAEESLTKLFCGTNNFVLSSKVGDNLNFTK